MSNSSGWYSHPFLDNQPDSLGCNASILKPFVPFTKSQVLLVELKPHISGIPSPVILKVYDPRFTNDRAHAFFPGRPWSLSLEIATAERSVLIMLTLKGVYFEDFFYGTTDYTFSTRS
jgi:hypothetical protein